ncbi:MAG: HAD family hydrolase [Solirubrobacterales bacterium]
MFNNIEAAIFDMDGTLIDSMWVWKTINFEYLAKRNIEVPEDLKSNIEHLTFTQCAQYFKDRFNIEDSKEDIMAEWNEMASYSYSNTVKLKPGAREYLLQLKEKGVKLGIATSNYSKLVNAALGNNDVLHFFDAITTTEEVTREKNFPDIYLLTAEKLKVDPSKCMVFEDILPAVKGAKLAGMKVIGVQDEYSLDQKEAITKHSDLYIEKYEELTKAL